MDYGKNIHLIHEKLSCIGIFTFKCDAVIDIIPDDREHTITALIMIKNGKNCDMFCILLNK